MIKRKLRWKRIWIIIYFWNSLNYLETKEVDRRANRRAPTPKSRWVLWRQEYTSEAEAVEEAENERMRAKIMIINLMANVSDSTIRRFKANASLWINDWLNRAFYRPLYYIIAEYYMRDKNILIRSIVSPKTTLFVRRFISHNYFSPINVLALLVILITRIDNYILLYWNIKCIIC